jgi:hypothetical protein
MKSDKSILCTIGGFELPFPITVIQIEWFVAMLIPVMLFANIPPLSWIDNPLLKYLVLPIGIGWFMSQEISDVQSWIVQQVSHKKNYTQTVTRQERTEKRIFSKSYDDVAEYRKDMEERKKNAWAAWEHEQKGAL